MWELKAECLRIDAFELWCWRRLLRGPWATRRSNQSILKEISPEYSLKGLMLKLKLQYFGHLIWRADSLEKTLMLGKIEGRRRRGQQRMRWGGWVASLTRWTWVWVSSGSWWWTGKPGGIVQSMGLQRGRHNWATELNCLNYYLMVPGCCVIVREAVRNFPTLHFLLFFFFGCAGSLLRHGLFLVVMCGLSCPCVILAPQPGIEFMSPVMEEDS